MSMPCGRCNSPAENEAIEIPGSAASSNDAVRRAAHYNRLDIAPQFRLTPKTLRLSPRHTRPAAPENRGHVRRVRAASTSSPDKVFLVHGGASSNKQVSGVTR